MVVMGGYINCRVYCYYLLTKQLHEVKTISALNGFKQQSLCVSKHFESLIDVIATACLTVLT